MANERVLNEVAAVNDAVYVNQANLPIYISRLQNKHNQAHTAVSLCVVYIRSDFSLLICIAQQWQGLTVHICIRVLSRICDWQGWILDLLFLFWDFVLSSQM